MFVMVMRQKIGRPSQVTNLQRLPASSLDRKVFLGAALLQQRLQPARRQDATGPGFAIRAVVLGGHGTAGGFRASSAGLLFGNNGLFTFGISSATFYRLQIFGGNPKRLHLGADFFDRFVKLPRSDVSRLFLQFLDLALNIDKIAQDIFLFLLKTHGQGTYPD